MQTGDLSGTRTAAVDLTGHSEGRNYTVKMFNQLNIIIAAFYELDPPEDATCESESD